MGSTPVPLVSYSDVQAAHKRIAPYAHYTPLLTSQSIDAIATAALASSLPVRLAFKAEHLQRIGAFKFRGATNAVLSQLDAAKHDFISSGNSEHDWSPAKLVVVTHSSGNHAGALACAAKAAGAIAAVVMPENAPTPKINAVRGYGAQITFCIPTQEARESTAAAVMKDYEAKGYITRFIHPYDEPLVIAGQGTMALEMLDQAPALEHRPTCSAAASSASACPAVEPQGPKADSIWSPRDESEPPLDIVIAPVGGGGMLSGVSTAVKGRDERIVVIGAEPDFVNDAFHSVQTQSIQRPPHPSKTACDGLLTALSPRTLAHITQRVDTIVTAREEEVLKALKLHWERQKQLVEPSSAVGLATVLQGHNEAAGAQASQGHDKSLWGLRRWVHEIAQRKGKGEREGEGEGEGGTGEIRIGIVWSGGNVELAKVLAKFQEYGI